MISGFQGEYRFLSNFYPSPIRLDGVVYPTVENGFQAAKTLVPGERERFTDCTPAEAKRLGRRVTLRRDWESVKITYMLHAVRAKFRRHPELRDLLLDTGDEELVEANTWGDTYWGVCGGRGQNHLGRILMQVREEMRDTL